MEMKSLSEVTSGHGNRLEALLDFCLMSIPGVSQHSFLYTYFLCLEILGTKIKQGVPLSFPRSLKLYRFCIAGVLQLRSKYGFRGNATSSL